MRLLLFILSAVTALGAASDTGIRMGNYSAATPGRTNYLIGPSRLGSNGVPTLFSFPDVATIVRREIETNTHGALEVTHDMTTAMRSNLVANATNKTIIFKPGIYPEARLGAGTALYDLRGKSPTVIGYGAIMTNTAAGVIPGPCFRIGTNDGIKMFGFTFEGGGVVNSNGGVYAEIDSSAIETDLTVLNAEFAHMTFRNCGNHGIIAGGTNIWVHHNFGLKGGDTNHATLTVDGAMVALSGPGHRIEDNTTIEWARGIEIQSNVATRNNASIRRNTILRTTGDWDIGAIGSVGGIQDGIYIEGNTIEREPLIVATNLFNIFGISVTSASNTVIRGNTLIKATAGFGEAMNGLTIENNTFRQARVTALSIGNGSSILANRAVVKGNRFIDCDSTGLRVNGDNHVIDGNYFENISSGDASAAIYLNKGTSTTTNNKVINNVIVDTRATSLTDYGIYLDAGCARNLLAGNIFTRLLDDVNDLATATIRGDYVLINNDDATLTLGQATTLSFSNRVAMDSYSADVLRLYDSLNFTRLTQLRFSFIDDGPSLKIGVTSIAVRDQEDTADLDLQARGILLREGSNARMGTATLSSGLATVSTTAVTANSRVFLTVNAVANAVAAVSITNRVNGTSFQIRSTSATDANTVSWAIFEPAP